MSLAGCLVLVVCTIVALGLLPFIHGVLTERGIGDE